MTRNEVRSRAELLAFIEDLRAEGCAAPFENSKTLDFLEALGGWLADAEGFYANANEERDADVADWQLFADALAAATTYE